MDNQNQFFIALIVTIVVEMSILFLFVRNYFKIGPKDITTAKLIFAGFVSFFTLPYVWFVLPELFNSYLIYVIISEILVWLAEAIFYYFVLDVNWKKAIAISFICNLITTILGLLIL